MTARAAARPWSSTPTGSGYLEWTDQVRPDAVAVVVVVIRCSSPTCWSLRQLDFVLDRPDALRRFHGGSRPGHGGGRSSFFPGGSAARTTRAGHRGSRRPAPRGSPPGGPAWAFPGFPGSRRARRATSPRPGQRRAVELTIYGYLLYQKYDEKKTRLDETPKPRPERTSRRPKRQGRTPRRPTRRSRRPRHQEPGPTKPMTGTPRPPAPNTPADQPAARQPRDRKQEDVTHTRSPWPTAHRPEGLTVIGEVRLQTVHAREGERVVLGGAWPASACSVMAS